MTYPALITTPRAQLVIDWITSLGWDGQQEYGYPLFPGPEILNDPDQAVFITLSGGPGYLTEEGGVDSWAFQARVRGGSDDPLGPATAAQQLDWLILNASCPVTVDGVRIVHVHRLGAPPAPLPLDPSDRRFELTCTYLIVTGA